MAEIAERAGVSSSLVSAFLSGRNYRGNGKSGIRLARKTGERIRETCREMGYWPDKTSAFNRVYPELAEICTMSMGGRAGFKRSRFTSILLEGILDAAIEVGTKVSVSYFDPDLDYDAHPEKLPIPVMDSGVSKFIVTSRPNMSFVRALLARNKHVVYISQHIDLPGVSTVIPDFRQAANVALRYLINLGHRRIGFVADTYFKGTYSSTKFREGILDITRSHGVSFPEEDLYPEQNSMEETIERLFSRPQPPTALFGFDDISIEEAVEVLQKRGLRIPEDVSVVGCNDESESARLDPPLTTIHLPIYELGMRAVDMVNQKMVAIDQDPDQNIVLPGYLVERSTTRFCDS